ncbi:hypothetical protein [Candidatus Palauibacter sp.]|uniref:hypothetical protein n=1 Tax=Candidatus Palauibacter sp. TaxID=3101350 RepID=UPI003B52B7A6
MFEFALLGGIAVWLCRRRGWGRVDMQRALGKLGRVGRSALATAHRAWPGLLAQCAADMKGLVEDTARFLPSGARTRLERRARKPSTRSNRGLDRAPVRDGDRAIATASPRPEDRAVARLQRRYVDGRISLEEYAEAARALRTGSPRAFARPPS